MALAAQSACRLTRQLHQAGAAVIGFDILFAEPSEPAEDQALALALREAGNGVLSSALSVVNDPLFRHTIESIRFRPCEKPPGSVVPSSASTRTASCGGRGCSPRIYPLCLASGPALSRTTSSGNGGRVGIAAFQPEGTVTGTADRLPRTAEDDPDRVLLSGSRSQHLLPPGIFTGKIVLVGRMLEAIPEPQRLSGDTFLTPFSWTGGNPAAGVEIQATLVDNLLTGRFVAKPTPVERWLGLLALALVASLLATRLKPLAALIATLVLAALYLAIAWAAFAATSLWLPVLSGIMILVLVHGGHLLLRALTAERDRRRLLESINRNLEAKSPNVPRNWPLPTKNSANATSNSKPLTKI